MRYLSFFTVTLFLLIIAAPSLLAQEKPRARSHAFELGYGFWPMLQISSKINSAGGWGSPWSRESRRFLGAFNMGYSLDVSKRIQVGVTCSYSNLKEEYEPVSAGSIYEYRLEQTKSWAVMPELSYKWYDKEDGQVYSGLEMGVDFREETIKEYVHQVKEEKKELQDLAWHVTLLGAKLGNRSGVFVELGFGYAGYGTAGLFMKL